MPPRIAVIGADPNEPVNAAFGLGITISIFAFDQQCGGFNPSLLARMIVNDLNFHAPPFRPAGIHALKHFGPILAFRAPCTCVDFDISVITVRFARQQSCNFIDFGFGRKRTKAGQCLITQRRVTFHIGKFHQLNGIVAIPFNRAGGVNRVVQTAAFAHHFLSGLGVIPERLVFHPRVQFIQTAERTVPIQKAPNQIKRLVDLINMGLRFSAHSHSPISGASSGG